MKQLIRPKIILGLVTLFAIMGLGLWLVLSGAFAKPDRSVESFLAAYRKNLEETLRKPGNHVAQQIQRAHVTVQYKRGAIKSLSAITLDGSSNAGQNGENISEIHCVIIAYWQGVVHTKDGYTEIGFVYDHLGKQIKSVQYLDSNASINVHTIDWKGILKELALAASLGLP